MFDMFDWPKINCNLTTDSTKKYYYRHFSTPSQTNSLLKVTYNSGKILVSKF